MKMRFAAAALLALLALSAGASEKFDATVVAQSRYQWTGIAAARDGRIFTCYPSWKVPSPFKVAEISGGVEKAYPSEEDQKLFTCVQSVVAGKWNRLWVLDPANPGFRGVVSSGAKLFMVDLGTNRIERTYVIPKEVADSASYLNDVRVDEERGFAYMTNSTEGGIVVLDLDSGRSWVALDSSDKRLLATIPRIVFESTGPSKGVTHSDGIELSEDGGTLYFAPMTGDKLYSIRTDVLRDEGMSVAGRARHITLIDGSSVPCDGLLLEGGRIFMGDLPREGVRIFNLKTRRGEDADIGMKARWADSFASDGRGGIYFTTSQINYPEKERIPYQIIRITPRKR
ncbi:MAG: L-dopachrome tautomerase-related protein [Succinivibrio sp.]